MKLTIKTSPYNARRYSRPWIARVDFTDPKGKFEFGQWTGQHFGGTGSEGILHIEAEPGDVIAQGQKDGRGNNGHPGFAFVKPDGTLETGLSKAKAYGLWTEFRSVFPALPTNPLAGFSTEQLVAELKARGISTI